MQTNQREMLTATTEHPEKKKQYERNKGKFKINAWTVNAQVYMQTDR